MTKYIFICKLVDQTHLFFKFQGLQRYILEEKKGIFYKELFYRKTSKLIYKLNKMSSLNTNVY